MDSNITENVVIRDWLTFTSKQHDPWEIVEALGMSECNWTTLDKGWYGYKARLYFGGISVLYDGNDDMGVCCEMSGQGCRNFEEYSTLSGKWDTLLYFIKVNNLHVTRLDVAFDDHTGVLDIERVKADTEQRLFISRFRSFKIEHSFKGEDDPVGLSMYYGSNQSDTLVRIYDKAAERGFTDGRHWVRVELQLRGDRAGAFLDVDLPIGEAFAGVLLNYLRFIEPDETDSNKRRWATAEYWAELVGHVAKIRLYTAPGADYNLDRCKHYVVDMAGNAIAAMMEIYGLDDFCTMINARECAPNPKYEIIVREHHAHVEKLARDVARMLNIDGSRPVLSDADKLALHQEHVGEFEYRCMEQDGKRFEAVL